MVSTLDGTKLNFSKKGCCSRITALTGLSTGVTAAACCCTSEVVALLKLGSLLDFVRIVRLLHSGKFYGTEVGTAPAVAPVRKF